jgi:defect-in-organelle-trafficking protein DotB
MNKINPAFTEVLLYEKEPPRWTRHDIDDFILWATEQGTSDFTIQSDEEIRCEIHGKIKRVTFKTLSKPEMIEFITTIYKSDGAISTLNGGDDVDCEYYIKKDRNNTYRYRVNMTAVLSNGDNGYSLTIRTIKSEPQNFLKLGLHQDIIDSFLHKEGMIIIVGATGSGKSTLLSAAVAWRLSDPDANLKILTYESPIEFVYDSIVKPSSIVCQTEIGKHLPSFERAIRNSLRRKPNVILLGEMRDKETIGEAVIASMTGHLVLGTLHSTNAATAIRRMINVFEPGERNARAQDIISSLKLVLAQTLEPSTDGKRIAIREYLLFDETVKEKLIDAGIDNITYTATNLLKKYGKSFLEDATEKHKAGLISDKVFNSIKLRTKSRHDDVLEETKVSLKEIENQNKIKKMTDVEWKNI